MENDFPALMISTDINSEKSAFVEKNRMDVQDFWNVIGQYNQNTIIIQVILLILTNQIQWKGKIFLNRLSPIVSEKHHSYE